MQKKKLYFKANCTKNVAFNLAQTVGFKPTVLFSTNDFEGRVGKGKEGKVREDKGR